MNDLARFLLDRIAEDKVLAEKAAEENTDTIDGPPVFDWCVMGIPYEGVHVFSTEHTADPDEASWTTDHMQRWDPARVLAECEAKQLIVERHRWTGLAVGNDRERGYLQALDFTLRALALPYADHPDYRQEWKR